MRGAVPGCVPTYESASDGAFWSLASVVVVDRPRGVCVRPARPSGLAVPPPGGGVPAGPAAAVHCMHARGATSGYSGARARRVRPDRDGCAPRNDRGATNQPGRGVYL